jgi:hypothetical protein
MDQKDLDKICEGLSDVKIHRPQPGDILVFHFEKPARVEQFRRVIEFLKRSLPGTIGINMEAGDRIEVIRPPKEDT